MTHTEEELEALHDAVIKLGMAWDAANHLEQVLGMEPINMSDLENYAGGLSAPAEEAKISDDDVKGWLTDFKKQMHAKGRVLA